MSISNKDIVIGIVGVCGAGKTTLINSLKEIGYNAKHIAQEHSFVPDMWQFVSKPDKLIFLEVSYDQVIVRKRFNLSLEEYNEQSERIIHAKLNADIVINTNQFTEQEVLRIVLKFLQIPNK